jgi:hypothetical protein
VVADEPWIGLTEAIRQLRREIVTAMSSAESEAVRFELGAVEVELALTMRRTFAGNAGVTFAVASVGANGERGSESTHRVMLTLKPLVAATERSPHIAGRVTTIHER